MSPDILDIIAQYQLMPNGAENTINHPWQVGTSQYKSDPKLDFLYKILEQHRDKNFVDRIIRPDLYGSMRLPPGDKGDYGTHMMASSEYQGRPIAYPEIIQNESGKLQRLSPNEAYDYAVATGQFIPFNTNEEALYFGRNYKRVWGFPEQ